MELLFLIIVMATSIIEGIVGFGSTALALPFIVLFMDLSIVVPVLNLVVLGNALLRIIHGYNLVNKKEFLTMIGLMAIGIPFGIVGLMIVPENYLKLVLGLLIIWLGGSSLYKIYAQDKAAKPLIATANSVEMVAEELPEGKRNYIFLVLGGLAQAAFACGGIFAAIYGKVAITEQQVFRMTMFAQAAVITMIITIINIYSGVFVGQTLYLAIGIVPMLLIAKWISDRVKDKVDSQLYNKMVNMVLVIAGTSLVVQGAYGMLVG